MRHVVTQVVETELIVGAVGNIATVGRSTLVIVQTTDNDTDTHAQGVIQSCHPLRVTLSKVVVHGNNMHPVT